MTKMIISITMWTNYPKYLTPGDRVAVVSPSGALDPDLIDEACEALRKWRLVPVVGEFAKGKYGRFAGTDQQRLQDLQWAMDDPTISAILCGRGGYGVIRIVDQLDFSKFRESPKWLIGFSDITALHARFESEGFPSLHAVMARAIAHPEENRTAVRKLKKILFGEKMDYQSVPKKSKYNRAGKAQGKLVGGNLSLIYALQGTPYAVDAQNNILFVEDLSERLYHIDRMVQNLRLSGVFEKISGLVVGQFSDIPKDPSFKQTIEEIFLSAVGERQIPIVFNFPVGHVENNWPLVHGANVNLEVVCGEEKKVVLTEL